MDLGKAELMTNGRGEIKTVSRSFDLPSVIRLMHMVKRPILQRRLSRRAVFHRDNFTCQYCGNETKSLTIDHVLPRSRGGKHIWENVAAACIPCNHRKAGMTPREASMRLRAVPRPLKPNPYYLFQHRTIDEEWRPFIPWVA